MAQVHLVEDEEIRNLGVSVGPFDESQYAGLFVRAFAAVCNRVEEAQHLGVVGPVGTDRDEQPVWLPVFIQDLKVLCKTLGNPRLACSAVASKDDKGLCQ